ncbi:MAG: hypothetical protein QM690_05880 [Sphingobium sp.]
MSHLLSKKKPERTSLIDPGRKSNQPPTMPAFDHHFLPLTPPVTKDEIDHQTILGTIFWSSKTGQELVVRLIGARERIFVIAITVPETAREHPNLESWMKQIKETLLTAIRLAADAEAAPIFFNTSFLTMMSRTDNPEPRYEIMIDSTINKDYRLNTESVIGFYGQIAKKEIAPIASLLSDAQIPAMPPQYRVLSLVRAIELLWPDEQLRRGALSVWQARYEELNIGTRPLESELHVIRTRCAHGRSRGRVNPEPFVGIGYGETTLSQLVRLLRSVVITEMMDRWHMEFGGDILTP